MSKLTPELQAVIERVRKLSKMADKSNGATENEINVAMGHIQRLLAEHNLSMSDILETKATSADFEKSFFQTDRMAWDKELISAVMALCEVEAFFQGPRICFVGYKADVALAGELYKVLKGMVRKMGEKHATEEGGHKTSYRLGLCERLRSRSYAILREKDNAKLSKLNALVVLKKENVKAHLKEICPDLKPAKTRTTTIDQESYDKGYEHGGKVSLNTKVIA